MAKKLAPVLILITGTLWGIIGIFVRRLNAAGLGSQETTLMRISTAALIIGIYLLLFRRDLLRVRLRDLWCFFGTGIVSLLLFSWCYVQNMNLVSLSVAAILLYTAPAFVMLLSALLFRERITARKLVSLVLAFGGCVFVSGIGSDAQISAQGLLLGLGSGFFYSLYTIFSRFAINRGYHSFTITFYTFVFCTVGNALLSDWGQIAAAVSADHSLLAWFPAMGIVTAVLPNLCYAAGLVHVESGKASIICSVEPVVGTLVGVFFFHEMLPWSGVVGVVMVLAAIALLSGVPAKKSKQSVNIPEKEL